ncbi:MAG: cardiolipin synthase [Cyclobacteriaceae bacterium]|jgi:cardiolipin synthase|nr:cardiolipin synthase [Cyclobacteriaceae bacterium]
MWLFLKDQSLLIWLGVVAFGLFAAVRVVLETRSPSKTAAYLLLIILFPVGGPLLYFLVGVNYRKRRIYSKKLIRNTTLFNQVRDTIQKDSLAVRERYPHLSRANDDLINLLLGESLSPLSENRVTVLLNGEQKFPALLEAIDKAKKFIHLEYYIFEEDTTGARVKDALIKKAREGVKVRIIFDDFGSHRLWRNFVDEFRENGVEIYPFFRIHFVLFANRINFRDHRKVVIIDGNVGFLGGMNIADRYVNGLVDNKYWRDTHVKIEGGAVLTLQYHFLSNWNFCSGQSLGFSPDLFPETPPLPEYKDLVQIVTGGPDYPRPSIMLSYFTAIMMAKKSVYITTPYFIPNETMMNAIKQAAFSGKEVRVLIPERSDSAFVDAASRFYFLTLLEAGVKIHLYTKGLIHAKTMVVDDTLSIIGTANMDLRSFELNFEINAIIYSERVNAEMKDIFWKDLEHSYMLDGDEWGKRNKFRIFLEGLARILAPLL